MQDIYFNCSSCGQPLEVEAAGAGLRVDCPECGASLTVPSLQSHDPVKTKSDAPNLPPVINSNAKSVEVYKLKSFAK